jgi:hypothetical protein
MDTLLEFLDGAGSESIAAPVENWDGPVPAIGDIVYLDFAQRFRVVRRLFHLRPSKPGSLTEFIREMKVSLHCERLPEGSFY